MQAGKRAPAGWFQMPLIPADIFAGRNDSRCVLVMVSQGVNGISGSGRMLDSCNSEPAAAAQEGRSDVRLAIGEEYRWDWIFAEPWFQLSGPDTCRMHVVAGVCAAWQWQPRGP